MVILKFVMIFFLIYLTALTVVLRERQSGPSAPLYYQDMSFDGINSIQPLYRISADEAQKRSRYIKVLPYANGMPYCVIRYDHGKELSRLYYLIDGYGNFRYIVKPDKKYGDTYYRLSPR